MSLSIRITVAVLILAAATAVPQVAHQFSYQGYLTGSDGNPVPDGIHQFVFELYEDIGSTTPLWRDTMSLSVSGGQFDALLGSENPLPLGLFSGPSAVHYLEVTVDGEVLSPRTFIGGQPYSGISKGVVGDSMSLGEKTLTFKGASSKVRAGIISKYGLAGVLMEDTTSGETLYVADDGGNVKAASIQANGPVTSGASTKDEQIVVDGPGQKITATSGTLSFDNENLVTTGNVGVGTTPSSDKLTVGGSVTMDPGVGNGCALRVKEGGGNRWAYLYRPWDHHRLSIYDDMSHIFVMTFDSGTGNVGIGPTTPSAKLEVAGTVYSTSGGFKFPDGTTQTTAAGGGSKWTVTDSVLYTNSYWGLARGGAGNKLHGDSAQTHVNFGVACTTGVAGQNARYCTVAGGYYNKADSNSATVGGGEYNLARGPHSTISGGGGNYAPAGAATVCGGLNDDATGYGSFVGGGRYGAAYDSFAVVCGGDNNEAGRCSAVCGGQRNHADTHFSGVLGGRDNGLDSRWSAIIGGDSVIIDKSTSEFAAAFGEKVYVNQPGTACFYSGRSLMAPAPAHYGIFRINRDNQDDSTSIHPLRVGTGVLNGNGAYLTAGGTWTNGSSREFKENFAALDAQRLLSSIAAMPVESWNYKGTTEHHIGPVAEDFVAAFDVGTIRETDGQRDNQYLAASDVAGVALAGVKELIERNRQLEAEVAQLKALVQQLVDQHK